MSATVELAVGTDSAGVDWVVGFSADLAASEPADAVLALSEPTVDGLASSLLVLPPSCLGAVGVDTPPLPDGAVILGHQ